MVSRGVCHRRRVFEVVRLVPNLTRVYLRVNVTSFAIVHEEGKAGHLAIVELLGVVPLQGDLGDSDRDKCRGCQYSGWLTGKDVHGLNACLCVPVLVNTCHLELVGFSWQDKARIPDQVGTVVQTVQLPFEHSDESAVCRSCIHQFNLVASDFVAGLLRRVYGIPC